MTTINLGGIAVVEPQGIFVQIRSATKIRILFSYPPIIGYNPEEENRQSEKLELPERSKRLYEIIG